MKNYQQNLPCFLSSGSVHTIRDCLTYDMTNYLKAMKNSLNRFINDIIFGFQKVYLIKDHLKVSFCIFYTMHTINISFITHY